MGLQLILCLETNKTAATDFIYINETIKHFFKLDNTIKISPVYMNGKTNYNSTRVEKQIKKLTSDYSKTGTTQVIYCIDTDAFETDMSFKTQYDNVEKYCKNNGYELIWFCHDVE